MISKQSISSSFHYFSPSIVRKGLSWMIDISSLVGDEESVIASFKSTSFISTLQLKNEKIISMECDCGGPKYCVHLAGLLFYVKNNPDVINFQEHDNDSFLEKDTEPFIRSGKVSSYRKVLEPESLLNVPESEGFFSEDYILEYRSEIYSDRSSKLNILVTKEENYYYEKGIENPALVQIKWINESLYIKCHECHHTTNALCNHQTIAVSKPNDRWINRFVHQELDINDQYEVFSETTPFTASILKKHYDIGYYGENRMYLRAKSDITMITEENVEHYEGDLEIGANDPEDCEDILDTIYERDDKASGNAILWAKGNTSLVIRYLQGKLSKNKKKLIAFIEKTDNPEQFPVSMQRDLNKMNLTRLDYYDDLTELQLQNHLELLHNHATHWNNHLHYIYSSTYSLYEKIKKSDLHLFAFADEILGIELHMIEDGEAILVHLKLNQKVEEKKVFHQFYPLFYVVGAKAYVYQNSSIYAFIDQEGSEKKLLFSSRQKSLAKKMISKMINKYGIDLATLDKKLVQTVTGCRRTIQLSQYKDRIQFHPVMKGSESEPINFDVLNELCHPAKEDPYYISIPSPKERDQFLHWFRSLHPRMDSMTGPMGFCTMHIEDFSENQWFLHFSDTCEKAGVTIEGWDSLDGFSFNPHRADIVQTISAETDWFDIHFTIQFGDIIVPQKDWIKAVKKGDKSVLLKDGTYGIIPEEWRLRMTRLLQSAEMKKGELKLSKLQFNALDEYVNLEHEPEILKDIEEKKDRLVQFKGMKSFDIPEKVQAELRPYQTDGYNWLKFLNEYRFGGCLADDMGLGKTLQVLCLLVDQKENGAATSLVVVPRSLMHNWAAEIEKFCPGLTYVLHHGSQRTKKSKDFSMYDVVISTYGTVVNDIAWLKNHTFHYAILDESQAIKNSTSRRYKSMIQLSANHKLTMTGTPVENSTLDLFAQFNFINPGLLGNKSQFRKRFADPIDKGGDKEAKDLLRKIVYPFLLRRTKNQVTKDLPPKTESILYCEMAGEQRVLYHKMKNEIRASLLDTENLEQNKIKVLEGLLKLRQICNSPALLKGNKKPASVNQPSVKIDTLMEQIEEVVGQEDHSILVFSQFTSMLALVRERLDRAEYDYAYLDGSTSKRQDVIESFNTDPDKRIFLISLKAGNTGLNLTKADFVYLLDPWWNPAVEAQAIDRTHRIGQTNPVFAYRFICKDTIEEKIMHLQSKKSKLVEDLIQTDENVFKSLDKEALINLFE